MNPLLPRCSSVCVFILFTINCGGGTGGTGGAGGTTGTGGTGGQCTTGEASSCQCNGSAVEATQAEALYFPSMAAWNQDVTSAGVANDSGLITQWMVDNSGPNGNGWAGGSMAIDFGPVVLSIPSGTAPLAWQMPPVTSNEYSKPDCDLAKVPVPPCGACEQDDPTVPPDLSGMYTGYKCSDYEDGGDCHMLFVDRGNSLLYEIWRGTMTNGNPSTFIVGCLAIWDTSTYSVDGRGKQCTSADAAGLPIAPLLFSTQEIKKGGINHAIRFTLPNSMIRAGVYVSPATHASSSPSGPATSPPYGAHFRLHAQWTPPPPVSPAVNTLVTALKTYGMFLADGSKTTTLTAQSDLFSSTKWTDADVNLAADALSTLKATDFDVLQYEPTIPSTQNCTRVQIMTTPSP